MDCGLLNADLNGSVTGRFLFKFKLNLDIEHLFHYNAWHQAGAKMSDFPTLIDSQQSIQVLQRALLDANASRLHLITGELRLLSRLMQHLIDHLALRSELLVIVGGNRYSLAGLPFLAAGQQLHDALDRIRLTRAETPYQLLDALQSTQAEGRPVVVTDILVTLRDDGIDDDEATRILVACQRELVRLASQSPVLISAAGDARRPGLFDHLQKLASQWHHLALQPDIQINPQPSLF